MITVTTDPMKQVMTISINTSIMLTAEFVADSGEAEAVDEVIKHIANELYDIFLPKQTVLGEPDSKLIKTIKASNVDFSTDKQSQVMEKLTNVFNGIDEIVTCPIGKWYDVYKQEDVECVNMRLRTAVMHLNDLHKWTREDIADWIETLDIDTTVKDK